MPTDFEVVDFERDRMRREYAEQFDQDHGDCECFAWHRKPRCNWRMCERNPHLNFYCPRCHEVACGMKRQGQWIVLPHYKEDIDSHLAGRYAGMFGKPCRGGPVDYDKDRAP